MKLKLLITPIIIILAVVFTAAFILPKALEAKDSFDKFKKSKQELEKTLEKIEKAKKLGQELKTNTEKQNILLRYIPASKQEEEIINNLNAIAASEGLAVASLSPADKAEAATESALSENGVPGTANAAAQSGKAMEMANAEMDVVGNYDQIKAFLEKVGKMQRVVNILSLEISKVTTDQNADPNKLQASMDLGFGYLEKVNIANANNEILDKGKFDMSVIEKIKNNAKTDFSGVEVGQTGKANPFIP